MEKALQQQRRAAEQGSAHTPAPADTPAATQDQAATQRRGPELKPSQPAEVSQHSTSLAARKAAKALQRCNRPKSANKVGREPLKRAGGFMEAGYASGSGSLMDYVHGSWSFASFAEADFTVDGDIDGAHQCHLSFPVSQILDRNEQSSSWTASGHSCLILDLSPKLLDIWFMADD